MNITLKNWGTPDGVAGHIYSLCPIEATEEARRILFYRMGISIQGGHFELFKETHHTDEDVKNAKMWLRKNHDVVDIKIVQEICESKDNFVSLKDNKQLKINNLWDNLSI